MIRRIAVAATIGLLFTSSAMAGEIRLGGVQGSVLVNQNGRFVPVTAGTTLRAGDRIMAMDGSASVTYADGCKVNVGARSMATVGTTSPCAGGSSGVVRAASSDGYGSSAGDDDGSSILPDCGSSIWCVNGGGFGLWTAFGITTAVVVGNALSSDEKPSSP